MDLKNALRFFLVVCFTSLTLTSANMFAMDWFDEETAGECSHDASEAPFPVMDAEDVGRRSLWDRRRRGPQQSGGRAATVSSISRARLSSLYVPPASQAGSSATWVAPIALTTFKTEIEGLMSEADAKTFCETLETALKAAQAESADEKSTLCGALSNFRIQAFMYAVRFSNNCERLLAQQFGEEVLVDDLRVIANALSTFASFSIAVLQAFADAAGRRAPQELLSFFSELKELYGAGGAETVSASGCPAIDRLTDAEHRGALLSDLKTKVKNITAVLSAQHEVLLDPSLRIDATLREIVAALEGL